MTIETAKGVVLSFLVVSVCVYVVALGCYLFGVASGMRALQRLVSFFNTREGSYVFGLPISAATAFGIVMIFDIVSPFKKEGESLSFEAFGAKFSGPAAPATIWVVCYLVLVASMRFAAKKLPTESDSSASMDDATGETPNEQIPELSPTTKGRVRNDKGRTQLSKSRANQRPRRRSTSGRSKTGPRSPGDRRRPAG